MLGYAGPELSGKNFADITDIQGFDRDANLAYLVLKGDLPGCQFQRQIHRKNGESFSAEISVRIIRDKPDDPIYAIGFVREHPEADNGRILLSEAREILPMCPPRGSPLRRPDTQALLSTERYVRLFNSLSQSLAISTLPDHRYVAVSDGFLRLFGAVEKRLLAERVRNQNFSLNRKAQPRFMSSMPRLDMFTRSRSRCSAGRETKERDV